MEKSEFRMLIKHYFLRGKTLSETKAKLDKYYSDSAPSYGIVQKWFTEFHCGRVTPSEQNLAFFNRNPKEFFRRFVTMDKT